MKRRMMKMSSCSKGHVRSDFAIKLKDAGKISILEISYCGKCDEVTAPVFKDSTDEKEGK